MALTKESARTPSAIGAVNVRLALRPDGQVVAGYEVEVLDASGAVMRTPSGDLWPHLTATQQTTITNFLTSLKTKAQTEIL